MFSERLQLGGRIINLLSLESKFIAVPGLCGQGFVPGLPAGSSGGDAFQRNAVDRARRKAQFAARATGFDHGVHGFGRPDDAVYRAGLDAQGAANTPIFIDDGHASFRFLAVCSVEGQGGAACQLGKAMHTFLASGRALVDFSLAFKNGLCVAVAIREAAASALSLGQRSMDD